MQEKIAQSLIPHEQTLAGSFYGKFFARNLNLYLLQRNPEQWKTIQASRKSAASQQHEKDSSKFTANPVKEVVLDPSSAEPQLGNKTKRKARPDNEIDQLFEEKLGKKVKRAELKTEAPMKAPEAEGDRQEKTKRRKIGGTDKGLEDVLGAIKAAPKDEKRHHKKKKAV